MENIHKQTLTSSFQWIREKIQGSFCKNDEINIHQKHLQFLAIEVLKSTFFENHDTPYKLRCRSLLKVPGTDKTN